MENWLFETKPFKMGNDFDHENFAYNCDLLFTTGRFPTEESMRIFDAYISRTHDEWFVELYKELFKLGRTINAFGYKLELIEHTEDVLVHYRLLLTPEHIFKRPVVEKSYGFHKSNYDTVFGQSHFKTAANILRTHWRIDPKNRVQLARPFEAFFQLPLDFVETLKQANKSFLPFFLSDDASGMYHVTIKHECTAFFSDALKIAERMVNEG